MENKNHEIIRKTIFMDSNALSRLSIYIEFCHVLSLNPNDASIDLQEGSSFWNKIGYPRRVFALEEGIKEGKKLFSYLKQESEKSAEILTTQLCEFEFLHILVERKADLNLIEACIPYRLRTKKISKLFLSGWNKYDYNEITQELEDFQSRLSDEKIEYKIFEEQNGVFKDIYKVARLISKHILFGTSDIYVYASAILAESDELITFDRELRDIAKDLKHSKDRFWKKIREDLLKELKEIGPPFKDSDQIILPDIWAKKQEVQKKRS